MATISELVVYPIKSCAGISVETALMLPTGLAYDRRWMVVDEATGRAVTQRQLPKMAVIRVSLPPALLAGAAPGPGDALTLSAAGVSGEVAVPLAPSSAPKLREAKVWAWSGVAADEGDAAAAWLSSFLGRPVRLVRYLGTLDAAAGDAAAALAAEAVVGGAGAGCADEGARAAITRSVDPLFIPEGAEVAFADGFPLLLATQESLDDLNGRLGGGGAVKMSRFRANVVLSGAGPAWADDAFGTVRLGGGAPTAPAAGGGGAGGAADPSGGAGVEVVFVKPCSRCTVPLVEQETGVVAGKEPIATMQGFRSGRVLGFDKKYGPGAATFFAQNGQPLGSALLRVGDAAAVLKAGSYAAAA
ncbi:MAG: hypothetical protein J3K34DRAFT_518926 [Monoraphidium minutum]|nr:MAG: hypothetical protein J3K34DRAFT_518926 [Monoraphidium minutum]